MTDGVDHVFTNRVLNYFKCNVFCAKNQARNRVSPPSGLRNRVVFASCVVMFRNYALLFHNVVNVQVKTSPHCFGVSGL